MAMTIRTTRAGRTIIQLDGCSDYYGGALMQGAIICKISIPANIDAHQAISSLPRCPNAGPNYIDAIREAVPGIRVYSWSRVQ